MAKAPLSRSLLLKATAVITAATALTIPAVIVTNPPPSLSAPPAITGTAQVGQTLSCSTGSWANNPTSYSYQWRRNGQPIAGSTGATRALTTDDAGATMTCIVTATNAYGSTSASSNATTAVGAAGYTISGTLADAIIGQPYDSSFTVTPTGSPIELDQATIAALSAKSIAHNGFGRFTSSGVTA